MERIKDSIIIKRPVEVVFDFLRAVEPRLRLNPSYELKAFSKLTEGPIMKGTRFRITFQTMSGINEYESEIVDLRENEFIKTRDVKGRLSLTLSVRPTPEGTLLTHEEEFIIPVGLLREEEDVAQDWRSIFRHILRLDRVRFIDHERERKISEIKDDLMKRLQEWLRRIKENLEASPHV